MLYAVGEEGFSGLGGVGAREEGLGNVLFWGRGCHSEVGLVLFVGSEEVGDAGKKMVTSLSVGPRGTSINEVHIDN